MVLNQYYSISISNSISIIIMDMKALQQLIF